MKSLALLLLLIGIVAIVIGYTKTHLQCPPPRVEYRYVPRKYLDEQIEGNSVQPTWATISNNVTPWRESNDRLYGDDDDDDDDDENFEPRKALATHGLSN